MGVVTGRLRSRAVVVLAVTILALSTVHGSQGGKQFPLESPAGLRLHNVTAESVTLDGKKGLRVTVAGAVLRRLEAMTPEERARVGTPAGEIIEQFAIVEGIAFGNGVIEAEIAGEPQPNAPEGARGFVGIAFRLQDDARTYDAFYLRPTNGRADDQVRRNHSAQYISHPNWPWFRLRAETPERYESYVDLVPGAWTRVKIDVLGTHGRLYVHGQAQPTLIVNDLKSGPNAKGGIALWLEGSTVAHFRGLTVTPEP